MDEGFERAIASARSPVLIVDDDRRYVGANDAALRFLGLTREELMRRRIDDVLGSGPGEEVQALWADFLQRGGQAGVVRVRAAGGRMREVRYSAVARVAPGRHLSVFVLEDEPHGPLLTPREREVMQLVAHGRTTREVAKALVVSPTTVETHVRSAMDRLGARNRSHAVALALARGEVAVDGLGA